MNFKRIFSPELDDPDTPEQLPGENTFEQYAARRNAAYAAKQAQQAQQDQADQQAQFQRDQAATQKAYQSQGVAHFFDSTGAIKPLNDPDSGGLMHGSGNDGGIAYGNDGQPKRVKFADAMNAPVLTDAYEGLAPKQIDGNLYAGAPDLPYKYLGPDPQAQAEEAEKQRQKQEKEQRQAAAEAAAVYGAQVSQSRAKLQTHQGALDANDEALGNIPELRNVDLDGNGVADSLEQHFSPGDPAYNEKTGWFGGGGLSPASQKLRDDLAQRKAQAADLLAQRQSIQQRLSVTQQLHEAAQRRLDRVTGQRAAMVNQRMRADGLDATDESGQVNDSSTSDAPVLSERGQRMAKAVTTFESMAAQKPLGPNQQANYEKAKSALAQEQGKLAPPGNQQMTAQVHNVQVTMDRNGNELSRVEVPFGGDGDAATQTQAAPSAPVLSERGQGLARMVARFEQMAAEKPLAGTQVENYAKAKAALAQEQAKAAPLERADAPQRQQVGDDFRRTANVTGVEPDPNDASAGPTIARLNAKMDAGGQLTEEEQARYHAAASQMQADDAAFMKMATKPADTSFGHQAANFGANIVKGLAEGAGEIVRSPIGQGVIGLADLTNPLTVGKALLGGGLPRPEDQARVAGEAIGHSADGLVDPALKDTIGAKVGGFVGGVVPYVAAGFAGGPAVLLPTLFSSGYQGQYETAKAKLAETAAKSGKALDPEQAEATARKAGLLGGAINTVLGLPFEGAAGAVTKVFGGMERETIAKGMMAAFEKNGALGVNEVLHQLKAKGLTPQAGKGIDLITAELTKGLGSRAASIAQTAARDAAIGAGVQVAQNVVARENYDPERPLTEGVGEQALGFGAMGALSQGARQAVLARQVADARTLNRPGAPPDAGGGLLGDVPRPPSPPARPGDNAKPVSGQVVGSRPLPEESRPGPIPTSPSDPQGRGEASPLPTTSDAPLATSAEVSPVLPAVPSGVPSAPVSFSGASQSQAQPAAPPVAGQAQPPANVTQNPDGSETEHATTPGPIRSITRPGAQPPATGQVQPQSVDPQQQKADEIRQAFAGGTGVADSLHQAMLERLNAGEPSELNGAPPSVAYQVLSRLRDNGVPVDKELVRAVGNRVGAIMDDPAADMPAKQAALKALMQQHLAAQPGEPSAPASPSGTPPADSPAQPNAEHVAELTRLRDDQQTLLDAGKITPEAEPHTRALVEHFNQRIADLSGAKPADAVPTLSASPTNEPVSPSKATGAALAQPVDHSVNIGNDPAGQSAPAAAGERAASAVDAPSPSSAPQAQSESGLHQENAPTSTAPKPLIGEKINSRRTAFAPESGTLGIPREDMPQVAAEHRGALANFLKGRGIDWQNEDVSPASLKPSQADFNPGKVEKARSWVGDSDRRILVSSDNHVIDGHHQWLARLQNHPDEPMPVVRLNAPARDILSQIHEFPSAGMEKAPDIEEAPAAPLRQGDQAIYQGRPATIRGIHEGRAIIAHPADPTRNLPALTHSVNLADLQPAAQSNETSPAAQSQTQSQQPRSPRGTDAPANSADESRPADAAAPSAERPGGNERSADQRPERGVERTDAPAAPGGEPTPAAGEETPTRHALSYSPRADISGDRGPAAPAQASIPLKHGTPISYQGRAGIVTSGEEGKPFAHIILHGDPARGLPERKQRVGVADLQPAPPEQPAVARTAPATPEPPAPPTPIPETPLAKRAHKDIAAYEAMQADGKTLNEAQQERLAGARKALAAEQDAAAQRSAAPTTPAPASKASPVSAREPVTEAGKEGQRGVERLSALQKKGAALDERQRRALMDAEFLVARDLNGQVLKHPQPNTEEGRRALHTIQALEAYRAKEGRYLKPGDYDTLRAAHRALQADYTAQRLAIEASQEAPAPNTPGPITSRQAGEAAHRLLAANRPMLKALGVQEIAIQPTKAASGIEFVGHNGVLVIDPAKLAESMTTVRDNQAKLGIEGTPEDWFAQALAHEGIHAADVAVAREKGQTIQERYDALPEAAMPEGWQEAGRDVYGAKGWDALPEWKQKAEFVRAVIEGKWTGRLTEQLYKFIREAVDFLKRVAGFENADPRFKAHVQEVVARIEALHAKEKAPGSKPPRTFKMPHAPTGTPDALDHILEQGGMVSPAQARSKPTFSKLAGDYDGAPTLGGFYHHAVFGGKLAPDQMAEVLRENYGVGDGSVDGMWKAVSQAVELRKKVAAQQQNHALAEKQAARFDKDALRQDTAKGKTEINTANLAVGDKITVGDQTLKVVGLDPDTLDLELEDHSKYGVQKVADGETLFVEKAEPGKDSASLAAARPSRLDTGTRSLFGADEPFDLRGEAASDAERAARARELSNKPADERPAAADTLPKLRSGENQGDLLSKQTEDLALVGEKGVDHAARQQAQERADREASAARAAQEREQQDLFAPRATEPGPRSMGQAEKPAAGKDAPAAAAASAPPERLDAPASEEKPVSDIADFGEKIGGARKDTARPLGSRPKVAKQPENALQPAWMRKYDVAQELKRDYATRQDTPTGRFAVIRTDGVRVRSQSFPTAEEAQAAIPLIEVARNHGVSYRKNAEGAASWHIFRQVGEHKRPVVKSGFASEDEAKTYLATHPQEIIEHKFAFPERPWLDRLERTGGSPRVGHVNPKMFQEAFGFRGGEFGNWNLGGDGQAALNHAYDALHDLADILGVSPRALSLNGELAIAFGARGTGGENAGAAHYEPGYQVINLTKIKGAGSLAHEWFHALDHYLGRQDGKATDRTKAADAREASGRDLAYARGEYVSHGFSRQSQVREALRAAFKAVTDATVAKPLEITVPPEKLADLRGQQAKYVRESLDRLRQQFATYHEYSRTRKPATPEQLAEFDRLAGQIADGEVGAAVNVPTKNGGRLSFGRMSYAPIEELNALYKGVLGRSFATNDEGSLGKKLYWQIGAMKDAQRRVDNAGGQGGAEKQTRHAATDFLKEARQIDQRRSSDYWSAAHEMGARSFESFVADKLDASSRRNDYLVHGTDNRIYSLLGGMKPYPEGEERAALNRAWQKVWDVIEEKPTDRGSALYAAKPEEAQPQGAQTPDPSRANTIGELVQDALKPGPVERKRYVHYATVSPEQAARLKADTDLDLEGYHRNLDNSTIRHIWREHGDPAAEIARGNAPLTQGDFEHLPEILNRPDASILAGKNSRGQDVILHAKRVNGYFVIAEEVREPRGILSLSTVYKKSAPPLASSASGEPASTLLQSNAQGILRQVAAQFNFLRGEGRDASAADPDAEGAGGASTPALSQRGQLAQQRINQLEAVQRRRSLHPDQKDLLAHWRGILAEESGSSPVAPTEAPAPLSKGSAVTYQGRPAVIKGINGNRAIIRHPEDPAKGLPSKTHAVNVSDLRPSNPGGNNPSGSGPEEGDAALFAAKPTSEEGQRREASKLEKVRQTIERHAPEGVKFWDKLLEQVAVDPTSSIYQEILDAQPRARPIKGEEVAHEARDAENLYTGQGKDEFTALQHFYAKNLWRLKLLSQEDFTALQESGGSIGTTIDLPGATGQVFDFDPTQKALVTQPVVHVIDKLQEAKLTGGHLPETHKLDELGIKDVDGSLPAVFDAYFGKDRWVLKSFDNAQAFAGQGNYFAPKLKALFSRLAQDQATPQDHGALDALSHGADKLMVQRLYDVDDHTDRSTWTGPVEGKEARVHVMTDGGKARPVPYATWIRGEWVPSMIQSEDVKGFEEAARKAVEAAPEADRQGSLFGVDVMRKKDGTYGVVELNPTEYDPETGAQSMSGYASDNPLVQDAIISALWGRLPTHAKVARMLLAIKAAEQARQLGANPELRRSPWRAEELKHLERTAAIRHTLAPLGLDVHSPYGNSFVTGITLKDGSVAEQGSEAYKRALPEEARAKVDAYIERSQAIHARQMQENEGEALFAAKPSDQDSPSMVERLKAKAAAFQEQGAKEDRIAAGHDAADTMAGIVGRQAGNSIRLDIPDALDRQAAGAVVEAGGRRAKLESDLAQVKASPDKKLAAKYAPIYQRALDHLDKLQATAAGYRQIDAQEDAAAERAGLPPQWQRRIKHLYDDPLSPESTIIPDKGFGAIPGYATAADAIAAGADPGSVDLGDLAERRVRRNRQAIHARAFQQEVAGMKAADGKPILSAIKESGTQLNADGSVSSSAQLPKGYKAVQAGENVLVVHRDFAPLLEALYGESAIRQSRVGNALLDLAALAKHGTAVLDTYHGFRVLYKEVLGFQTAGYDKGLAALDYNAAALDRAVKAGQISQPEADYARQNAAVVARGLQAGLNVNKVADNLLEAARQHNLIERLPLVGKGLAKVNELIFHKLQRGAMVQAYVVAEGRNRARFPELSEEQAARRSAREVNEFFGNLGSQGFLKSKTMQDLARLTLFAPQWSESQARAEARGFAQGARIPLDAIRGKGWRAGAVAQAMGGTILAALIANQALNLFTRGKPTWENEEEGRKWDAWIPGGAHNRGFWFSPLSIAAEYSHAMLKYLEHGENALDAVGHVASNKLSGPARGVKDLVTGKDYAGRPFASTGERLTAAAVDALPSPMPLGAFLEKNPKATLGYALNHQPGSIEKQGLSMIGLKVDAEPSARSKMYAIAEPFRARHGGAQPPSDYSGLRRALDAEDRAQAEAEIRRLLEAGKPINQIGRALGVGRQGEVAPELFTGSKAGEEAMWKSLTAEQRRVYQQAQRERGASARRFTQYADGVLLNPKMQRLAGENAARARAESGSAKSGALPVGVKPDMAGATMPIRRRAVTGGRKSGKRPWTSREAMAELSVAR